MKGLVLRRGCNIPIPYAIKIRMVSQWNARPGKLPSSREEITSANQERIQQRPMICSQNTDLIPDTSISSINHVQQAVDKNDATTTGS